MDIESLAADDPRFRVVWSVHADDCIIVRIDVPNDITQFLCCLNSGIADDRQIFFDDSGMSVTLRRKTLTDE
jgi:hypothetical protein